MSDTVPVLKDLRRKQIAHRDRIESILERQANVTDQIDAMAIAINRLPSKFTVAQARNLEVLGREILKRAGVTRQENVA